MASSSERRQNGSLPPPASPTDSVAQAMKSDLEELIGYIDNLAFEEKSEKPPVPKSVGTHSMNKELFPNDRNTSSTSILQDRTNKFTANARQVSMLDKLKDSDVATAMSPARYHDSSVNLSYERKERDSKMLEPVGNRPRREEPAGSPPSQEASLYFHDESFSLNLSQSQEADESNISDLHFTDKRSMEESNKNRSGRPPRLLSTLQKNGLLSSPERSKTIAFLSVSKDPTPSKPIRSSSLNLNHQNHFATPTAHAKNKTYSSDDDGNEIRRKRLATRQATPFPKNQDRDLDRFEQENLDRKGNEWWRARPVTEDDPSERDSSVRFDSKETSSMHENGDAKSLKWVESFTSPIHRPKYARGTPYPSKKAGDRQNAESGDPVLETPVPRQDSTSNLVLTSPESARKLLQNAMEALQDARKERDEARQWANDIKLSVNEWMEDQRQLIRTESASIADNSNTAPTAVLEQKHRAIENLINDLRNEMKSSKFDAETQLQMIVRKQDEKIRELSHQLSTVQDQLTHLMKDDASKKADAHTVHGKHPKKPERSGRSNSIEAPGLAHKTPTIDTTKLVRSASRSEASHSSQRTRRATPTGGHLIDYGNGVTKELHPDGTTVTRFKNGDVETRFDPNSSTKSNPASTCMKAYYHCKEEVLQITQRDGSVLYEYANGQVERHCADGVKIVLFPDGTKTIV